MSEIIVVMQINDPKSSHVKNLRAILSFGFNPFGFLSAQKPTL